MSLRKNLKKNNMWSIIKFDKKKFSLLKEDLKIKFGQDIKIYTPKICIENFRKNRLIKKEINLLGDYLFCFHNNFSSDEKINSLKFTRGLKYILNGHSFRTEGIAPPGWFYMDGKYIQSIHRRFGSQKIKTFPKTTETYPS